MALPKISKKQAINLSRQQIKYTDTKDLIKAREFILELKKYRQASSRKKTYINGVRKALDYNKNGKIYYELKFEGTKTGRLSCASQTKDSGISFHTLSRVEDGVANIRNMFVAPKGYGFITADYSSMEVMIAAHLSKDPLMITAINNGLDFHTFTAQQIFNKENITKEERQIAKSVTFLILYGGGANKLSLDYKLSYDRANEIIDKYKNTYSSLFEYIEQRHRFIRANQYTESIFGRVRHLSNVNSKVPSYVETCLRQGFNFEVQSAASDITLFSILGSTVDFRRIGLKKTLPQCMVHDSGEYISAIDELKIALEIIYHNMVNYPLIKYSFGIEFLVPLKVDIECGPSFGTAKEVHFERGKVTNFDEIVEILNER